MATNVNMKKLEEAVHYICTLCTAADDLGSVKLNKVLYYADMLYYAHNKRSITGATYVKQPRGPVPKEVEIAKDNLINSNRLHYNEISIFDLAYPKHQFSTSGATNMTVFKSDEIDTIKQAKDFVCARTGTEISEISHTVVWEAAEIGEELPYNAFFVSYLGDLSGADLIAASNVIRRANKDKHIYG
jgi:hypothetical protein